MRRNLILSCVLLTAAVVFAAPPAPAQEAVAVDEAISSVIVPRKILLGEDLGLTADITLVGIHGYGSLNFGIPDHWDVQGDPELHMKIARSSQLLPHLSSITVWLDGRPVGTVKLDGEPGMPDDKVVRLPLSRDDGYHQISFVAYHRTREPCKHAEHPGMWSRILDESFIQVNYRPVAPELSLSTWPYPFRDDREPDTSRVVLVLPEDAGEAELTAAGHIASLLGHVAGWRPMALHVHIGSPSTAPDGHLIAISTLDAPSGTLSQVRSALLNSESSKLRQAGEALRAGNVGGAGLLALMPRPEHPTRAMLAVVGRDARGVEELGRFLSSDQARTLAYGPIEFIDEVRVFEQMDERDWQRTIPQETSFTLAELGFGDIMASGYKGGRVSIPMHLIPDEHPISGAARLELVYSYSAQSATEQSRLDVSLNGAAAGGVALRDVDGRNRVKLLLELPAHEMGPESRLDIDFALQRRGEEDLRERCEQEPGAPLWGTVHADSRITLPRDHWGYVPDLGLLRYGAFPFGLRPDLSDTVFVLRKGAGRTELQFFIWMAAEMGRATRGDRFAYDVQVGSVESVKGLDKNIVLIDSGPDGDLIQRLGLLDSMSFTPKGPPGVTLALASGGMVALGADPKVAYIEEIALPWAEGRTGIVAYAADGQLFERVGRCIAQDSLFDRLRGKVTRVGSCSDLAAIPASERQLIGEKPVRESAYEPIRNNYWLLVAGIAIGIIFVLALRGFYLSLGRRREYEAGEEYEPDYGEA